MNKTLIITLFTLLTGCAQQPVSQNPMPKFSSIPEAAYALLAGSETDEEKLSRLYYFVRDEIQFDFIYPQDLPAETVLRNGKGVCMQKANLFVALAREAGFRARFRFMYVSKQALEDFLPPFAYKRWMDPFPHTFPEIWLNGKWTPIEPTFDTPLHDVCIKRHLNFARYPIRDQVSIEFSMQGVVGHQQFFQDRSIATFTGEDLTPLIEWTKNHVPWYKRILQPLIYKKASDRLAQLRSEADI
jgi:hypothetical protein